MAYLVVPLGGIAAIAGLVPTAFGLGAGRGLGFTGISLRSIPALLSLEILGAMLGAVLGPIDALVRPIWPRLGRPIPVPGIGPAAEAARGWSWSPIWLWVLGIATVLPLAMAFGVGVYCGRMVDRRVADAIEVADRDDPNWRVLDLMAAREAVPDEENSALVVAEVLSQLPEDWPLGPKPPSAPVPPKNDLTPAVDRLHEIPDNVRLDDATLGRLHRETESLAEPIRLARTLAGYRRGRHELVLGPTPLDTRLPETQASRTAARLLELDAALLAHDGQINASLDSCRAIIGVGRSIGDEPFAISQLVRIAEGHVALKAARRALGQGEASDEALARFQVLALDDLARPLMLLGFKGERANLVEIIRRIAAGEMAISALSEGGSASDRPGPIAPWGLLMFENQMALGLEWTNQLVTIARQPDPARPSLIAEWQAEVERVRRGRLAAWNSTLPILMMPALDAAMMAEARYHAELGALAIMLAAERQRLKTGDWPATIAAIDPALLPETPVDPWTGLPFRYERRDGRLLVYSVGPNLKDDRGELVQSRWSSGGPDDCGTVAWDVPLRRQPPAPAIEAEGPARSSGQP